MLVILLAAVSLASVSCQEWPKEIDGCLQFVADTVTNWEAQTTDWKAAKETCKQKCEQEDRIPQEYRSCFPPGGDQIKRQISGIYTNFKRKILNAAQILKDERTQNRSLCTMDRGSAVRSQAILNNLNKDLITGPLCFFAMISRFLIQDTRQCMCDCMQTEVPDRSQLTEPDLDESIGWLSQGANGMPPISVLKHSPKHAALCIFQFCEKETIERVIEKSGLAEAWCTLIQAKMQVQAQFPTTCQCLARVAEAQGVALAPTAEDCSCMATPSSGMAKMAQKCNMPLPSASQQPAHCSVNSKFQKCKGWTQAFLTDVRDHRFGSGDAEGSSTGFA